MKAEFPLAILASAGCCRGSVLTYGTPESVGMLSEPLKQMVGNLSSYTKARNYTSASYNQITPIEPGGVTLVAHKSVIVSEFAFGKRNLYATVNGTTGTLLPQHLQEDATVDTIYDMASLTKLYTSVAALVQVDQGRIEPNATVATYLPKFGVNGKENITILQLVTHTSGLQPDPEPGLYTSSFTSYEQRVTAILNQTLTNPPGTEFVYSDLNFMTLMLVLETVTGSPLDDLVGDFTGALGMTSTFFNRGNVEGPQFPHYHRMATEEFQLQQASASPRRPQPVRGTVHDENAWALNGVSGHAGLFSTVRDTARFCQMILNNGTYGGKRILSPEAVDLIFTNFNTHLPDPRSFGFELNATSTVGPLASMLVASHTGFTGTSVAIDRASNTFWLHFANRVHPLRTWSVNNVVRRAAGYWVAKALGRDVSFP